MQGRADSSCNQSDCSCRAELRRQGCSFPRETLIKQANTGRTSTVVQFKSAEFTGAYTHSRHVPKRIQFS